MIKDFRGKHYFLSNFYEAPVSFNGIIYANSEAAFQAQKVFDIDVRRIFATLKPNIAKKLGRAVRVRPDWEAVKITLMYEIVKEKFIQNLDLARKLIQTGEEELVESNTWNDKFWGVYENDGENHLGKILMRVREELCDILSLANSQENNHAM